MKLLSRVTSLERAALIGGGICCAACGLPRHGWPRGFSLAAVGPAITQHLDDIAVIGAEAIAPPCALCGRSQAFRIPVPERARAATEDAA